MENALPIPLEPPPSGQAKGKKRWKERIGTRTNQWDDTQIVQKMARRLNQLEELNQKLIGEQIDCDKVHVRELEKREKDRKKVLSNFHRLYSAKMKRQERKYAEEMKEERVYYVAQMEEMKLQKKKYVEKMKDKRENYVETLKQCVEKMKKGLLNVAQKEKTKYETILKERELQHAKEI